LILGFGFWVADWGSWTDRRDLLTHHSPLCRATTQRKTTMTTRPESIAPSLLVLASLLWLGLGSERRASAGDRPSGPLHKTRSAVLARQGMAATSQPLATAAAIR